MMRSLFLAVAFVTSPAAHQAAAQTAAPAVELGIDASALLIRDRGGLARGPRLVVNFDGRNALQVTTSLQALSPSEPLTKRTTDLHLAAFKRVVHAEGPVRAFTTLGGGFARTLIVVGESALPGPPPVTFPASRSSEVLPAFTVGGGVDVRVGAHAAIVLESSFILTDRLAGRLSAGVVVPIGAYPTRPRDVAASTPWAGLAEGDRAWVTNGQGREIAGEVVLRSASRLTLHTAGGLMSFAPDEIDAIDTTDSIRNGIARGVKIGALGALAPSVLVTYLACAFEEECGAGEVLAVNALFVGIGAGIGSAIGALADSLRDHRAPLYRRTLGTGITVTPLLRKQGAGVAAVVRW
ncbi:MAG: hypothetical protein IT184_14665 [Acidobacteria bacterium]|nr:hypothetical protein [Acidobacteriota bacterium]